MKNDIDKKYDIAVSYASEDNEIVEEFVKKAEESKIGVYYDKNEKASLLGRDLNEVTEEIYGESARFCLIFISKNYINKKWPNDEFDCAVKRELRTKEKCIIPIRLDNAKWTGSLESKKNTAYFDLTKESIVDFVNYMSEKMKNAEEERVEEAVAEEEPSLPTSHGKKGVKVLSLLAICAVAVLLYLFSAGTSALPDYINMDKNYITDLRANVMWQRSKAGYMNLSDARKYRDKINGKKSSAFRNWRLPHKNELLALRKIVKKYPGYFPDENPWYWSGDEKGLMFAWAVKLGDDSDPDYINKDEANAVLLVRSLE
ncbi:MAG: TIR domain-containing protein [Desulfobacteraceae bacterium]|nr:TIR domain-containing protein [Desulfobacteraceae bacterium]